ncbi:hypothetical protein, partial [Thiolapillus sp.]|uniref:hypothetical protein n=1 Tax=Thiolapillus sp. TaxID=2017437 RepID=UPI003AF69512
MEEFDYCIQGQSHSKGSQCYFGTKLDMVMQHHEPEDQNFFFFFLLSSKSRSQQRFKMSVNVCLDD